MISRFDFVGETVPTVSILNSPQSRLPGGNSGGVQHIELDGSALGETRRNAAWRRERVSVAAYYLAERRGFTPGGELSDWTRAELQTDAIDEATS